MTQNSERERDYLKEAFKILTGESLLIAQREHLIAVRNFYLSKTLRYESTLRTIREIIKDATESAGCEIGQVKDVSV